VCLVPHGREQLEDLGVCVCVRERESVCVCVFGAA